MNKIIVRRSVGGWLIFAGIGFLIMINEYVGGNYRFNGIAILGAAVFATSIVQLLFTRPRVIIDHEGISAVVLGQRKFLWQEIRDAELQHMHRSGDKITLVLHDNTRHSFTLFGVNVSADAAYTEIMDNISKHKVGANDQSKVEDDGADDFI